MTNVLLVKGKAWYSLGIKWFTWDKYSHVALLIDGMVYEATSPRVRAISFDKWYEEDKVPFDQFAFKTALTEEQEMNLRAFCMRHVGDRYAYNALFRFVFRDTQANPGKEEWICSRYVFAACNSIGVALQERISEEKVSPMLIGISPLLTLESMHNYE